VSAVASAPALPGTLLELSDDQMLFRETSRQFLDAEMPVSAVRSLYESPQGFDRAWWRSAAALGWTSLFVPERHGGGSLSGRPAADATLVAEEIGRHIAPGPFLPVNVVADAIARVGTDKQQAAFLAPFVDGTSTAAWAFGERGDRWWPETFATRVDAVGEGLRLDGEKAFVESADTADLFLVTARSGAGLTQVLVPAATEGVTVIAGRSVDVNRRFGRVRFDGVRVGPDAVLGRFDGAGDDVERQLALVGVLQCAELLGLAEQTVETTIAYGRERTAFGRPIVSFQVLKHRLADMAVFLEASKAVTEELAGAVDASAPRAGALASVAKAYVADHALAMIDDCVQITGGMGVTWEHDLHLFNRRAVVTAAMFGSPATHRRRLVTLLTNGASAA